jgi:hypothetical protein
MQQGSYQAAKPDSFQKRRTHCVNAKSNTRKLLTCISSKHSSAAIRSPLLLLLLLPAQPACGSALSALMKLRAAADITAALAAASRASGTLPARASLHTCSRYMQICSQL